MPKKSKSRIIIATCEKYRDGGQNLALLKTALESESFVESCEIRVWREILEQWGKAPLNPQKNGDSRESQKVNSCHFERSKKSLLLLRGKAEVAQTKWFSQNELRAKRSKIQQDSRKYCHFERSEKSTFLGESKNFSEITPPPNPLPQGEGEVLDSFGLSPTYFFKKKVSKKTLDLGDLGEILPTLNPQNCDNLSDSSNLAQTLYGDFKGQRPLSQTPPPHGGESTSPSPCGRGLGGGANPKNPTDSHESTTFNPQNKPTRNLILPLGIWDYSDYIASFLDFLDFCESCVSIFNPTPILRWNLNKKYLLDLPLPITKSALLESAHFSDFKTPILKPLVGQSGKNVFSLSELDSRAKAQNLALDSLLNALYPNGALVQEFITPSENGEVCLIFFNGEFCYAINRILPRNQWRANAVYGAKIAQIEAKKEWIDLGEYALNFICAKFHTTPLYARIDLLFNAQTPLINEIELIEPSLYFSTVKNSAKTFTNALKARIEKQ